MKTLRTLTEDLHALLDVPTMGITVKCVDLSTFEQVQNLVVQSIREVGALTSLTPDDLRTWNTFVIGVGRCASMSPQAGRGHLGALWRAGASEVCRSLPKCGHDLEAAVSTFLDEGPHG